MTRFEYFSCPECGNNEHVEILMSEKFSRNNKQIVVKDIPTLKCTKCGALSLSHDAMMYIETQIDEQS
ncbi:YgiT-type zinc finger protein [Paenibacillus alkalitolerans]|uniref:YgiT-type zinc finger protein n=1 Tax=Paenibacillus alkalitolerans TaxID=2799335 RepID=UPI0018F52983|nr:YgiT-type zinc finger protein [Paenibacillus alkalitolerans]